MPEPYWTVPLILQAPFCSVFDAESNVASGDTAVTVVSGADEDSSLPKIVKDFQDLTLKLMHDCWHSDPEQRPKPLELLNTADTGWFVF